MTWDDLPLCLSIYRVYQRELSPGAEDHVRRNLDETYCKVLMQVIKDKIYTSQGIPYSKDQVASIWRQLRKGGPEGLRLKCEVTINTSGSPKCFYSGRDLGECSNEVDLDRIVPGSRGGDYRLRNCILVCSKHNRSRGDQEIEEFLKNGWSQMSTEDVCDKDIPY